MNFVFEMNKNLRKNRIKFFLSTILCNNKHLNHRRFACQKQRMLVRRQNNQAPNNT